MAQNPLNKIAGTVVIDNASADSAAIDCLEQTLSGIVTPSALTNASMRFKVSLDGTTYVPLYDDSNTLYAITVATGASQAYALSLPKLKPWRWVKINMSGNEGAARSFGYVLTGV